VRRPDPYGRGESPRRRRRLGAAAGLVLAGTALAGCAPEERPRLGFPESATEQGHRVMNLWQGSWLAGLIVGALVWGLIGFAAVRYRRRRRDEGTLPTQTRYNLPVEILYTITPVIVVTVLFYFTWRDQNALLELDENPDHTVHVVAQRWSWTFNYVDEDVFTTGTPEEPPTLVLPQGKTVEFVLTTADVVHSFWIPSFLFKLDMMPRDPNVVQMTPEKLGTFSGKCAELCGDFHSRMLFAVEVVTPEEYDERMAELEDNGFGGQLMPDLKDEQPGGFDPVRIAPGEEDE
jgi:cytochrome c oxidase subunit 2